MKGILSSALCACSVLAATAGYAAGSGAPKPLVVSAVDATQLAVLAGNTRPEANAANDEGAVADSLPLQHMLLQLKRSPEREAALTRLIDDLHDAKSQSFHQWLTPEDFAAHYGVAAQDVAAVKSWLQSHGFTVNGTSASGLTVDFSGTAAQVRQAFRTEIHNYRVKGVSHIANSSDPQVPAALSAVVAGIVSLHDFRPKTQLVKRQANPGYTYTDTNGTFHALVAGDIATIYNLKPLFAAGYSGKGESIMVVEDTYLYSTSDWQVFRDTFGLSKPYPHGSLSQVSPKGGIPCKNPGFQGKKSDPGYGDDGEAVIDVEWASAAAPNAAIVLAACEDTTTTFGGLIALVNTLDGPAKDLPSVVSISYGEAEAVNGQTANLSYYFAYQQAAAEGVSVFVSSGDENAASADEGNPAKHGISVSGFTSTPYNVSVGGLDFGYTAEGVDPSMYWSAKNTSTFSSALSYIQEIPWDGSCASTLVAAVYGGTTPAAFCNSSDVTDPTNPLNFFLNAFGGSGGPSGCAVGTPSVTGVVSGTCIGYPKPWWQAGLVGNPRDGVRDIPDVSLFASNGIFDAYYVVCWSNPDVNVGGGFSCTGAPSTWAGFGGTSVSSPIMAGIQALVNQKTKSRWGNPNIVYYTLARFEYGFSGSSTCNSTTVDKKANHCVFYDVTQGDIQSACKKLDGKPVDCFITKGDKYGLLSTSDKSLVPAYLTNVGWDFPSGIGSVNAYNLVMDWPDGF
jgi:subtilase family serine protease